MSLPPNQPKVTPHTTIPPGGAGTTSHPPRVSGLLKKNLPLILGGTALLAGAYYIYRAGGDAKLAKTFSESKYIFHIDLNSRMNWLTIFR